MACGGWPIAVAVGQLPLWLSCCQLIDLLIGGEIAKSIVKQVAPLCRALREVDMPEEEQQKNGRRFLLPNTSADVNSSTSPLMATSAHRLAAAAQRQRLRYSAL